MQFIGNMLKPPLVRDKLNYSLFNCYVLYLGSSFVAKLGHVCSPGIKHSYFSILRAHETRSDSDIRKVMALSANRKINFWLSPMTYSSSFPGRK